MMLVVNLCCPGGLHQWTDPLAITSGDNQASINPAQDNFSGNMLYKGKRPHWQEHFLTSHATRRTGC
jgi:hypothetical protein